MQTPKVKATYGKRNGNKSRLTARDSNSPSTARPLLQFREAQKEFQESPSTPPSLKRRQTTAGNDDEPQSIRRKKLALLKTEQADVQVDEHLFDFPDSPPPETPKEPTKLNLKRRERVKEKKRELLQKQAEEQRRKKEAQLIRRFDSPSRNKTNPTPVVFDDSANPLSPPPCLSIENSPEAETEPVTPAIIRHQPAKRNSREHSTQNSPSPALTTPAPKRLRLKSPLLDEADSAGHDSGADASHSSSVRHTPAPFTPIRVTESSLNVKSVTQAEKEAWSFLEEVVPVIRKPKLVANLGLSKLDKSDSDTDNEIDTQTDGHYIGENVYESLSDRIPEELKEESTSSQSWQSRTTFSTRKTYGAVRSYLSHDVVQIDDPEKPSEPAMDLMEQLGFMGKEDSPEVEEEEEFGGNIKTVHELRTLGGNTRFQDEVQYILDGLGDNISGRRSSLLELSEKCLDREFVQDFKVSSMAGEFFTIVQGEEDPIATFLIGFIICSMLHGDKNIGLAAALVQSYEVVPLLMRMLQDTDDMMLVVRRRNLGISKIFQQLFIESLSKMSKLFLQRDDSNTHNRLIFSRSLIALSSFASLQGLEDKVDNILLQAMAEKVYVEQFFDLGEQLQQEIFPISKLYDTDPAKDEEELSEYRSNLHLLHLVTAQIQFMIPPTGSSIIITVAEMRDPANNYLLGMLRCVEAVTTFWHQLNSEGESEWGSAFKELLISILKLFILITTSYGYQQVSVDKFSRRGKLFAKIYEPQLANVLITLLTKLNEEPGTSKRQANNLELFSWGLLVNLNESEIVCEGLLESQNLNQLKLFINQAPEESSGGHKFHCQGYQSLVAGLLITIKGPEAFTAAERDQIKLKLSSFKESLSESWGHGLRNQVSRVVSSLEEIK